MLKTLLGFALLLVGAVTVQSCSDVAIACENAGDVTVTCPEGKVIDVSSAFYGRKEDITCGYNPNTNCVADGSLDKIKAKCQDKNSCLLSPSNSVFGDPCWGVGKYIEMKYKCVDEVRYTPQNVIACEYGDDVTVTCPSGEVIVITDGFFGRDDGDGCPGNIFNTNCAAKGSLNILRETCNNKQTCTIRASTSIFGDPCIYTNKMIRMEYYCVKKLTGQLNFHQSNICEDSPEEVVDCGVGNAMIVAQGFYGRNDITTCPGNVFTTDCEAKDSAAYLKCTCNNEQSCSLWASNNIFGDPCPYTYKYIQLDYFCVPTANSKLAFACEHQPPLTVQCPAGQTMTVVDGFYGRDTDVTTCPGNVGTTDCVDAASLGLLKDTCNSKNSCTLVPSNAVFGDPCPDTNKLIKMYYVCN